MRNTNAQHTSTMIPTTGVQQAGKPHVSHAKTGGNRFAG
jgi:hypothetical protein